MWLLPTYKRPGACAAVLGQINKVGCSTDGLVFVNGAEGEWRLNYSQMLAAHLPPGWTAHFNTDNIGCDAAMNWCFKHYPDEPFYGLICDDEYVYTPGWDRRLIAEGGTGLRLVVASGLVALVS
jgi:hypothetical protein